MRNIHPVPELETETEVAWTVDANSSATKTGRQNMHMQKQPPKHIPSKDPNLLVQGENPNCPCHSRITSALSLQVALPFAGRHVQRKFTARNSMGKILTTGS